MIDSGTDLSATVLKVGHHGSDTSTSYEFLQRIMPNYAVISVGIGNSYGHPHDETLKTLSNAKTKIYRTDLQGDIYCVSDGRIVTFTMDKEVSEDKILNSPAETIKLEQECQAALERERQQVAELEKQQAGQKPSGMIYIGNIDSYKLHYQSCSTLPKDSNRVYFNSKAEAIGAGYHLLADFYAASKYDSCFSI